MIMTDFCVTAQPRLSTVSSMSISTRNQKNKINYIKKSTFRAIKKSYFLFMHDNILFIFCD